MLLQLALLALAAEPMSICAAAAEASKASGWRYEVADGVDCAAAVAFTVPDDDDERRAGAWFEQGAKLAGYLLVEGDERTRVVPRSQALLQHLGKLSGACAAKLARPVDVTVKRNTDGATLVSVPESLEKTKAGGCLQRQLARAPLGESAASTSTSFHFTLTQGRAALGGLRPAKRAAASQRR